MKEEDFALTLNADSTVLVGGKFSPSAVVTVATEEAIPQQGFPATPSKVPTSTQALEWNGSTQSLHLTVVLFQGRLSCERVSRRR